MKFSVADFPSGEPVGGCQLNAYRRLRVEEFQGRVDLEELRARWWEMVSDPRWSPDQHVLFDLTEADLDLSGNEVLRLSLLLRRPEFRSSAWHIFAVPAAAYGSVRMLGYWTRTTEKTRIFRTRDQAEEWLTSNAGSLVLGPNPQTDRIVNAPIPWRHAG